MLLIRDLRNDSMFFKALESSRQNIGRNAFARCLEFAVAPHVFQEIPDNQ